MRESGCEYLMLSRGRFFTYINNGDGSYTLTPIQPETKERFPRGSLLKYFTPEKDKEETQILAACVQYPILLQNPSCYIGPGALDYRFGRGVKVGKFWLP